MQSSTPLGMEEIAEFTEKDARAIRKIMVEKISVDYYKNRESLRKIKSRLAEIYEKHGYSDPETMSYIVLEEVKKIIEARRAYCEDFQEVWDDPMDFYEVEINKVPREVLTEVFSLYEQRRNLKKEKGKLIRQLYASGRFLSKA